MNAAFCAFEKMFPEEQCRIDGVAVASGVSDQPMSDMETFQGAWNRALNAQQIHATADFCIGIEGGIADKISEMEAFAWVVVRSKNGSIGKGRTGAFFLPPRIAELIREGRELGEADDIVFGRVNSKQENGAVGILTGNAVDRTVYYTHAIMLALIPFKNTPLYRV